MEHAEISSYSECYDTILTDKKPLEHGILTTFSSVLTSLIDLLNNCWNRDINQVLCMRRF